MKSRDFIFSGVIRFLTPSLDRAGMSLLQRRNLTARRNVRLALKSKRLSSVSHVTCVGMIDRMTCERPDGGLERGPVSGREQDDRRHAGTPANLRYARQFALINPDEGRVVRRIRLRMPTQVINCRPLAA